MTPATFFEHFDTLADAPNAVAKLREMVLQMAVQGKLVPQDPNEEPASILVEKCAAEKAVTAGRSDTSGSKALPPVADVEKAFTSAPGWAWVRMSHISDHRLGKMLDKGKNRGQLYRYLRNTNVQWLRFDLADVKEMRFEEDELAEYEVRAGDLLVCEGGEPGRCAIWRGQIRPILFQKAIHRVRPFAGILPEFLQFRLLADAQSKALEEYFTGATIKHFTGKELAAYSFPLPPLAEQRRIVAKVDELMKLCDELETRLQRQRETRERLSAASLDRLLSARGPAEFGESWQRICDHFDLLYDAPETLAQLREAIITLAVQGRLVPKSFDDSGVVPLLDDVLAAREATSGTRLSRGNAVLMPVTDEEVPFPAPDKWKWVRLGELANIVGGVTLGRRIEKKDMATFPYLRVANVQRGYLDLGTIKEIEIPADELEKYRLEPGDVLLTEGGDWDKLGRSAIWRGEIKNCLHQNHIFRARPLTPGIRSEWISLFTNSPVGCRYFQNASKQTTNLATINMTQLRNCPIPLPSTKTQDRTLAKVDHLMSLCDALEAKLKQSQTDGDRLLAAAVHQLLNHKAGAPAPSPPPRRGVTDQPRATPWVGEPISARKP